MEYFNNSDSLTLMDTIENMSNEERHQLDMFLNSDRQDCAMDINLKTETNCGIPDLDQLDSTTDYNNLQWLPQNGLGNFGSEELESSENTDPNLLVNPQTVIPVDVFVNPSSVNSTLSSINSTIAQISSQNNIQIVTVTAPGLDVTSNINNNNNTLRYQTVSFSNQPNISQPQNTKTIMSPSLSSPVLVGHLQNGVSQARPVISLPAVQSAIEQGQEEEKKKQEKVFPKPVYSYSCLIALALKNSDSGNLPVSDIYTFMIDNYPYFKTAPDGWKNSVRHNLSLNKCFQKADTQKNANNAKKGCLWALNPAKVEKMEEEIVKWRQKDPQTLHHSMAHPEKLELIESGRAGIGTSKTSTSSSTTNNVKPITVSIPDTTLQSYSTLQHPSTPKRHASTPTRLPSTPTHHPSTPSHHPSTPTHHPSTPTHMPSTPNHHPTTPSHHPSTPTHPSDMFMSDLHDINLNSQFGDPALSELASGLWDDDLNCDLGLELSNPPLCIATVSSPMGSCNSPIPHQPTTPSAGYFDERMSYHGTCFYTSPVQLGSPSNIPNNILYATPSPRTLFT